MPTKQFQRCVKVNETVPTFSKSTIYIMYNDCSRFTPQRYPPICVGSGEAGILTQVDVAYTVSIFWPPKVRRLMFLHHMRIRFLPLKRTQSCRKMFSLAKTIWFVFCPVRRWVYPQKPPISSSANVQKSNCVGKSLATVRWQIGRGRRHLRWPYPRRTRIGRSTSGYCTDRSCNMYGAGRPSPHLPSSGYSC